MIEILSALATTPLPTILTVAGILFLFLAVAPVTIKGVMVGRPSPKRQFLSGIIGTLLLLGGVLLFWAATKPTIATETPLPTLDVVLPTSSPLSTIEPTTIKETVAPFPANGKDIAITEVMPVPCGGVSGSNVNEYIEIYNYGTEIADVNGWWIATNNHENGSFPDKIIGWEARNPKIYLGDNIITNSTLINPSSYAIILPPKYFVGQNDYHMPYKFPKGTTVLTIENSEYLGNDSTGLLNADPFSVIVLYTGTGNMMDTIISTFGAPAYGSLSDSIEDFGSDHFPYKLDECFSFERIMSSGTDIKSNWRKTMNGTPGYGGY